MNPSTLNPGTILSVKRIKIALIATVKSPKVIKVMGRVRIRRIGLRTAFTIPITKAVAKAEVKLSTWTPGNR